MFASKFIVVPIFCLLASFAFAAPIGNENADPSNSDPTGLIAAMKEFNDALTPEQRNQVQAIVNNQSLTKQQVSDSLIALYKSYGGDVEAKFNKVAAIFTDIGKKVEASLADKQGTMDPETKAFVDKILAIFSNMNITFAEQQKQFEDAYNSTSEEFKNKIKQSGVLDKIQAALANFKPTN